MKKIAIAVALALSLHIVCTTNSDFHAADADIKSYAGVPEITHEEAAAIAAVRAGRDSLVFGHLYETEAFRLPDGTFAGFTIELFNFLGDFFGVRFVPRYYEDSLALINDFNNLEIDFISGFPNTQEYMERYHLTSPVAQKYAPPIHTPTSIATANDELAPIISVINKYLNAGGIMKIFELYNKGLAQYHRLRLHGSFTDSEQAYLDSLKASGGVVRVVHMHDAYPASFYNRVEREYQGIAPDVLEQAAKLTGIEFEVVMAADVTLGQTLQDLKAGKISMHTHLLYSESRKDDYIWSAIPYLSSRYALLSKLDFQNLEKFKVYYHRVGLVDKSIHAEKFNLWYPNHRHTVVYANGDQVFNALERGEICLAMLSENMLWAMTNYREKTGYKINIGFDEMQEALFGYNKNETHLRSIVDKAMEFIDVVAIRDNWMNRTFDYSRKITEQQMRYATVGASAAVAAMLVFLFLFLGNKNLSRKLKRESEMHKAAEIKALEASSEKTRFLANVSHEIRTPLNAIIGMSELMSMEEYLSSRQKSYIKDIRTASHSLLSIVNDILDISKIEAGKLELTLIDYDFHKFISSLRSMFELMAQRKSLLFQYEDNGALPKCLYGDDLRLWQTLINIFTNAVNYTNSGHIRFKIASADGRLMFEIRDTGSGIKPENIKDIFTPFTRVGASESRAVQGTGLGLPISKRFIDLMDGTIDVESEYGRGTVFTVSVPEILGDAGKLVQDASVKNRGFFRAPAARVLVADDNSMNLRVAFRMLNLYEITACLAVSGREAVEAVQAADFDLVFMDHMMPDMDGIQAVGIIRALGGKFEKLPIVALTANAARGMHEMFLANGFDDYVSKPVELDILGKTLKKWLPPEKIETAADAAADGTAAENNSASETGGFWKSISNTGFINAEIGRRRVAGIEDMYRDMLELFHGKVSGDCEKLEGYLRAGDLRNFSIMAHGIKSVLATIGAVSLAESAFELETASKCGDTEFCVDRLPAFLENLQELRGRLNDICGFEARAPQPRGHGDRALLKEYVPLALNAAEAYNNDTGLEAVNKLLEYDFGADINEILINARTALKNFDFEEAVELLRRLSMF